MFLLAGFPLFVDLIEECRGSGGVPPATPEGFTGKLLLRPRMVGVFTGVDARLQLVTC